jgi:hypothetical protein
MLTLPSYKDIARLLVDVGAVKPNDYRAVQTGNGLAHHRRRDTRHDNEDDDDDWDE